jgi:hypothetical protein
MTPRNKSMTIRTTDQFYQAVCAGAEELADTLGMDISLTRFVEYCVVQQLKADGHAHLARMARHGQDTKR